jgi:LysM repeat protein
VPSIASTDFSATAPSIRPSFGGHPEIDRTRGAAELRVTTPDAPRLVRVETVKVTTQPQTASESHVSAASQTFHVPVATRIPEIAAAESSFFGLFTAPDAAPRYAKSDVEEKSVRDATLPALSVSADKFATSPTQRTVPLPAAKTTEHARATLPASVERLVRSALETPRQADANIELALSMSSSPVNTAVTRFTAPRVVASNQMRARMNLDSLARSATPESKSAPSPTFVSTAVPSTHPSRVLSVVRPTTQRATSPVSPTIKERKIAPIPVVVAKTNVMKPAEDRVAALLKQPATPRDQRNAITIVQSPSAKTLPAFYVAPSETLLSSIAARHSVSLEMLATVNNLKPNAKIARGQKVLFPREISVRYAGKPVTGDVASLMVGSTSVMAFRFLFEKNGGTMIWDAAKGRVIAKDGDREIILTVGSKEAMVNKKAEMMEMAAFLMSGRTMVPVRFFEKTMAAHVEWEPATGRLLVSVVNPVTAG